jgi:hypothetical protein
MGVTAIAAILSPAIASFTAAGTINEVKGLAIHGYDPVAYFTAGGPVMGSPRFTLRHEGATFRFASAAHRDSFRADPGRFAPAYGGFCAYGVSKGYKAKIEPEAFTIIDGRLYLNYNLEVREMWSKGIPGHIEKADQNWPAVAKTTKVAR